MKILLTLFFLLPQLVTAQAAVSSTTPVIPTTDVAPVAPGTLSNPTISVTPRTYYPLDEVLYLEGRGPAGMMIELLFEKISSGSQPILLSTQTSANGEWYFSQSLDLSSGEWSVRARAKDGNNNSSWSNPRIIRSVVAGFFLGKVKVKYLPVI